METTTFICEACQAPASNCMFGAKDDVEYRFYGCREHFMDLCTKHVNEGFRFKTAKKIAEIPGGAALVAAAAPIPVAPVQLAAPAVVVPKVVEPQKKVAVIENPSLPHSLPVVAMQATEIDDDNGGVDAKSGRKISAKGKLRALLDEAEAIQSGFILKRPLYSLGTTVIDVGQENFRRSRQEFEARPRVKDACDSLISQIQSEKRADAYVNLTDLTMFADGRMGRLVDNKPLKSSAILANADVLGQLMSLTNLDTSAGKYWDRCPTALRALNVNYWLATAKANKKVKLRVRMINGNDGMPDQEIYSVVTKKYSTFDINHVAAIVKEEIPEDARAEIVYDGFYARINVTFHSDIRPEDAVAGEIFKVGITIKAADDGSGSIWVIVFVERNLCLNLIVIDVSKQTVVTQSHTGDQEKIAAAIREGISKAHSKIEVFSRQWGFANKSNLLLPESTIDIEHSDSDSPRFNLSHELFMAALFNGMIERELVPVSGGRENTIKNLYGAWKKEPALTRAGVVNAMTRAAHEVNHATPWFEDKMQQAAGEILMGDKWRPLPWQQVDPMLEEALRQL